MSKKKGGCLTLQSGKLLDWDAVQRFKDHALSTEHPTLRHTLQNPDT